MTAIDVYRSLLRTAHEAIILNALVANAAIHCGEISCLKGIQGQKGYPM